MKALISPLISVTIFSLLFTFSAVASSATDADQSIGEFRQLQQKYQKQLQTLQSKVHDQLKKSQRLNLPGARPKTTSFQLQNIEERLAQMGKEFNEARLRVEVLDRLLYVVEKDFRDGSLRQFIEVQLLELAQRELLSAQSEPSLWKFMIYQSVAVRELAPKKLKLADFFESYMNYSSVSSPKKPEDFLEHFDYGNGSLVESTLISRVDGLPAPNPKMEGSKQITQLEKLLPSSLPLGGSPSRPHPSAPNQ